MPIEYSYFIFALFVPKAAGSLEVSFNSVVSQGSDCACTYPSDGRSLVKLKFMDFYKMKANGTRPNKKHNLLQRHISSIMLFKQIKKSENS